MKKVLLACGVLVLGIGGQLAMAGDKPKLSVQNGVSLPVQGQNATSSTTATMVSDTSVENDNPNAKRSGNSLTVNGTTDVTDSSSTSAARDGVPKTKSNIKND
ncbi:hypothetical protein ABI_25630 [Asticcacaulis biprosthecium C19]|uniref:Uncharacterized protein n=1 Tax=Asticcacaulis biprosthecium C19 TaxID=715226 RepID=F4QP91_9CAUL|nr:hypothetical protein [Asticcacaulis biprosthecium]EGF91149.1 hypothetical protein ABI_25630 [Asticcacaulis biprosthecium C19]